MRNITVQMMTYGDSKKTEIHDESKEVHIKKKVK